LNDPAFDNHPVVNISWEAARQYCTWRGQRLPTEAEWEAAAGWDARRGAKLLWPWGNDETPPDAVNLGSNAATGPVVVGSSSADVSAAGVMDMAGNVSEWVFDWYKVDYYSVADDTDPQGPTQRRGEGSGRGVRGGAFSDDLANGRTARRSSRAETYGYPMIGFRCAQRLE
jgi:formylglycine-generating enzyme required for sulfatase activity